MTEAEYWNEVRRLGLTPTNVPTVFQDQSGEVQNVPDPSKHTFDDRLTIIRRLKMALGIS